MDGSTYGFTAPPSPEQLAGYPLNDLGNAMRLIRMVGGAFEDDGTVDARGARLLYLRERGWIAYNGRYWDLRGGEELARRWAHKVAQGLIAQGPYWTLGGIVWAKFVTASGNAGAAGAMLAQAASYLGADLTDFDRDPLALNLANGVLRFRVARSGPEAHFAARHDPADRFTRMARAEWRGAEDPRPQFDALLAFCQPAPEMRGYVQKLLGYAATGSTKEQLFAIFQGKGGDGKSTLMNAVREVLGSYAVSAAVETFLDTGLRRPGEASPDIARLAGDTRLICTAEPPSGSKLASSSIKAFTGGAPIAARELRQGIFEFAPIGKVVLECNRRPTINDTDDGIWRRTRIVLFEHQVPAARIDRELPEKLRVEQAGILAWLADGVLKWLAEGLATPAPVQRALEDYRRGGNAFAEWHADKVILDPGVRTRAADLYASYKLWCEDEGVDRPMSTTAFGRALGDLQILVCGKDSSGKKMRMGARLRTSFDPDPDGSASAGAAENAFAGRADWEA